MRCAELVDIRRISPGTRDLPTEVGPGDALVRISLVGICGSDMHMYKGGAIGSAAVTYPFILGHEAMGVVEAVGSDVSSELVGQRVAIEPTIHCGRCEYCRKGDPNLCINHLFLGLPPTPGMLREHLAHPAELLEPIPDTIDDAGGVLLEPLAVALHAVDLAAMKPGVPAAVLGCGSIGLCVLALLKLFGCPRIFCTDLLDYRLDAARRMGATHLANAASDDVVETGFSATKGAGFPVVYECAGADDAHRDMARIAAPGARIMILGTNLSDRIACEGHLARRKGLTFYMIRRSRRTLLRSIALMSTGAVCLSQIATHTYDLDQVQIAFDTAAEYRDEVVKAMMQP